MTQDLLDPVNSTVEIAGCFSCGSTRAGAIIDLRPTPPANALASTAEKAGASASFPLRLMRCSNCGLIQLGDRVARDLLFREYRYATGAAPALVRHFTEHAQALISRHRLQTKALIVEIGSNDGTLLRPFAERGMDVLGVDPAVDLAEEATRSGITTLGEHFDDAVAERIVTNFGPADLVLANNVLAHVDDLNSVLRGIRVLIRPGGHVVVEVAHVLPMLTGGMFEFVYHEHTAYYSLHTPADAVARHGMTVVDVEEIPTQGGSLRCWIQVDGTTPAAPGQPVADLLARERRAGLVDGGLCDRFGSEVERVTGILGDLVTGLRLRGRRICGYGASARAVTLMAQAGIGDAIEWIADDNPRKVGMYVPGSATPVVAPGRLGPGSSDYCLVFAWNFLDEIVARTASFAAAGGRYLVPFPEVALR